MTRLEQLKTEIDKVENQIFMAHMADVLDWDYYYKLNHLLYGLKKELNELEKAVV